MNNILELNHVGKQYEAHGFRLKDVSFALPRGSIMGLVGQNGAGKSTTIGCILNTLSRDTGTISVFGQDMTDENTLIREDIGVVFDAGSFSANITALQLSTVMDGIYTKWDHALFLKYLLKFNLPPKKKIKTFSKGMDVKLSIATALSHHPKLLILDEATSGLDPIARDDMLDVFLEFVQEEDHSILLSSHITGDLEKIADYITFIHQGQIVLSEEKDKLIYDYGVIRCGVSDLAQIDRDDMISYRKKDFQVDVLVRNVREMERKYKGYVIDQPSIDEIMLLTVKGEKA